MIEIKMSYLTGEYFLSLYGVHDNWYIANHLNMTLNDYFKILKSHGAHYSYMGYMFKTRNAAQKITDYLNSILIMRKLEK